MCYLTLKTLQITYLVFYINILRHVKRVISPVTRIYH